MTALRPRLAAVALGASLALAAPSAAWATPHRPVDVTARTTATTGLATTRPAPVGRDLESLRKRCLSAVDIRLPALSAAKAAVASARRVTDDHRAALTAFIDGTTTRLQRLRGQIATDTEVAALQENCRSVFQDSRVFALILPRARLVAAADVATALAGKLDEVAGKLAAAIATAEAAGRDVTQARADLEAMKAKIAAARGSATSVPGAVLALVPGDWNANHDVLRPARQSLQSARQNLRTARELARKIGQVLRPAPAA